MNQNMTEPRPPADDTRLIPLSQGQFAIVDTADFEWLSKWNWTAIKGTSTWYARRYNGADQFVIMHRLILGLDRSDVRIGEHKNHNGLDNRRLNLRIATDADNMHNRRKSRNNSSGYKGVCWHKGEQCWQAKTSLKGRTVFLGYFDISEDAARAYDKFAVDNHGVFAVLNFPMLPTSSDRLSLRKPIS